MANLLDSIIKFIGNRGVFKDANSHVHLDGALFLDRNNQAIVLTDNNDNSRNMIYISASDYFGLGYGLYNANRGETRIYGDKLKMYSHDTITMSNPLIVDGHSSAIGTEKTANKTQNIASGTSWLTTGCSLSLEAGSWIITASISYASNASGRRGVEFYSTGNFESSMVTTNAVDGGVTRINTSLAISLSSTLTISVYGFQTSGSSLSQTTYMRAVRIA